LLVALLVALLQACWRAVCSLQLLLQLAWLHLHLAVTALLLRRGAWAVLALQSTEGAFTTDCPSLQAAAGLGGRHGSGSSCRRLPSSSLPLPLLLLSLLHTRLSAAYSSSS
jgi:hypothetical protein